MIEPITVTASPFAFTAPQDVLVLIGGGLGVTIDYEGIYPPNAGSVFGNPPTPGNPFSIRFNSGNDFAIGVFSGDEIIVTYTAAPQMYYVH